ncbi:MAG: hypothetical protein GWN62_10820, partial [Aliifodinibius sp.]|nr:hypothetical protein [Fodinibius sp.]
MREVSSFLATDSSPANSVNLEYFKSLKRIQKREADTIASQGFAQRLSNTLKKIYENYSFLPEPQLIRIVGVLLGNLFTLQNVQPDYRIDKSPTSTTDDNILEWYQLNQEELFETTDISDQPNFFYNNIYQLAKRI